ncbi:MAG: hypothetical protein WA958_02525 [Tunicatimonas sp.]
MKETTFESRAKEAFGDLYGKVKELEDKAKQLRTKLDEQVGDLKGQNAKAYDTLEDVKHASTAAFYDIREGVEQASSAIGEALKKASHHFK